jgi:hypothetical protein
MKLITAMIMRNEADRYLDEVLTKARRYSDKIVILDDNSDDNSIEVAEKHKATVYTHEEESLFWTQEHTLREYLWKQILPREAEPGDWILALDADEILGEQFQCSKDIILRQENVNTYSFQIWEAWGDRTKIRIDGSWNPLGKHTPMMTRYQPSLNYQFPRIGLHCGRLPMNVQSPMIPSGCSVLHLGWANPEEHAEKIERYTKADKNPHPVMKQHYESMLQPPELIEWWL